jgi:hypothetical protein
MTVRRAAIGLAEQRRSLSFLACGAAPSAGHPAPRACTCGGRSAPRRCRIACTYTSRSSPLSESSRHQLRQSADNAWQCQVCEHLSVLAPAGAVRACRTFGALAVRLTALDKRPSCSRCLPEPTTHKGPVIHPVTGPFRREKARSNRAVLPDQQPILSTPPDRINGFPAHAEQIYCAACICDFHYSFRRP